MNWRGIRIHVTHHAARRFRERNIGHVDPHRSIVRLLITAEPHEPCDYRGVAAALEHGHGGARFRHACGVVLAVRWCGRSCVAVTSLWIPGTRGGVRATA